MSLVRLTAKDDIWTWVFGALFLWSIELFQFCFDVTKINLGETRYCDTYNNILI